MVCLEGEGGGGGGWSVLLAAKDFVSGVLRGGRGERREGGGSYYLTLRNNYCKVWGAGDKLVKVYCPKMSCVFFTVYSRNEEIVNSTIWDQFYHASRAFGS